MSDEKRKSGEVDRRKKTVGEKGRVRSDSDTKEPVLTEGQFRDRTNIINYKRCRLFLLWLLGQRAYVA